MDATCLQYTLTEEERRQFEEDGFFVVRDVLPLDLVAQLIPIVDRLDAEARRKRGWKAPNAQLFRLYRQRRTLSGVARLAKDVAKVFGILGWHIQLYHTHLIVTPPLDGVVPARKRLGWHQDSGRLNIDMETEPRPRVSLKVAYFSRTAPRPIAATSTPYPART